MPCGVLNAMRFAQKPLAQPAYSFVHVPKATSDLDHSSLQHITNREHFQTCMAEMLLLGKEAVRRRKYSASDNNNNNNSNNVVTNSGAKPLSLEYLADRIDVDDPTFGYVVRTKTNPDKETTEETSTSSTGNDAGKATTTKTDSKSLQTTPDIKNEQEDPSKPSTLLPATLAAPQSHWKEGMLQGFITVTTFTNWQKSFRWDSLHPEAYGFDPAALMKQRLSGVRKWDADGTLAKELQQTVHCGDVFNEGIVWPRIAEISLLGGLGCGKTLVKLAIEHLENLKPSADQNYEYVVLQATDNSIPFYESMGFVRVGGIMQDKDAANNDGNDDKENEEQLLSEFVCSDTITYVTKKRGETPQDIAKKLKADVWDVLFLNKGLFKEVMTATSRLLLGTSLRVPVPKKEVPKRQSSRKGTPATNEKITTSNDKSDPEMNGAAEEESEDNITIEWFIAKENDTPSKIAKQFNLKCQSLIKANSARLPGLMAKSKLRNGTRVQVSHLHIVTKVWTAYEHWSSEDGDGEPSYMMCYKLQKRRKGSKEDRPVAASLKTSVEEYTRTPLLLTPPPDEKEKAEEKTASTLAVPTAKTNTTIERKPLTQPTTPILLAHNPKRDALVQVRVVSDGTVVKPSPMPSKLNPKVPLASSKAVQATSSSKPSELEPPKRSPSSFILFCQDMRDKKKHLMEGLSAPDASRVLANRWSVAPNKLKQQYEKLAAEAKEKYLAEKEIYNQKLAKQREQDAKQRELEEKQAQEPAFERRDSATTITQTNQSQNGPQPVAAVELSAAEKRKRDHDALYNKIIKIKPEALPFTRTALPNKEEIADLDDEDPTSSPSLQPERYQYYFCLTYIPDLKWCHLVPLVQVGEFTAEDKKIKLIGRPKWKLVNERLCQEIDVSSQYVVPVKSRETKHSNDADKEEWVVFDEEDDKAGSPSSGRKSTTGKKGKKRKKLESPTEESPEQQPKKVQKSNAKTSVRTPLVAAAAGVACSIAASKGWMPSMPLPAPTPVHGYLPPVNLSPKPYGYGGSNAARPPVQVRQVSLPPMDLDIAAFQKQSGSTLAKPSARVSLPPMDLDFSALQKPTVSAEGSSRSDGTGSPPTPDSNPPCACGSGAPCPVHPQPQAYHYSHYPPYPRHAHYHHQQHYHHRPPPPGMHGYPHPMHDHYEHYSGEVDPRYHYGHHGGYGPPGPGHSDFAPQEPYPRHHGIPPPPPPADMYAYADERHYYPPVYPHVPPAMSTPCHSKTSSAHLDLSVEREVAI